MKEELAAIGSRGGQPLRGVPAGLVLKKRSRSAECLPAWSWRSAAAKPARAPIRFSGASTGSHSATGGMALSSPAAEASM